jgi:small subunit ribosomal protein S17
MNKKDTKDNKRDTVKHTQELTGEVVRKSGDKTVAVSVSSVKVHKLYSKRRVQTSVFLAHDAKNEAEVGQVVTIRACRPLSARKRWKVVEKSK